SECDHHRLAARILGGKGERGLDRVLVVRIGHELHLCLVDSLATGRDGDLRGGVGSAADADCDLHRKLLVSDSSVFRGEGRRETADGRRETGEGRGKKGEGRREKGESTQTLFPFPFSLFP